MRRDFALPDSDVSYLDSTKLQWETITDPGTMHWVVIRDFPVCKGYTVSVVDLAIKIETGYPRSALDMVYFHPSIVRNDKKSINASDQMQAIEGKQYQRWSRHRTPQNPWREGVDDLSSHVSLISFWLEQEFMRSPDAA